MLQYHGIEKCKNFPKIMIFAFRWNCSKQRVFFLFVSESNRGGKKQRDLSSYQNSLRPNWPGWAQFGGKNDDILHNTYSALNLLASFFGTKNNLSFSRNFRLINSNFQIFRHSKRGRWGVRISSDQIRKNQNGNRKLSLLENALVYHLEKW